MEHLNRIKWIGLLLLMIAGIVQSCKKDPGNYVYTDPNVAVVSSLDTFYTVNQGQVLQISPKIAYTKDQVGDTANYTYAWLEINREGYNSGIPTVMAKGPVFIVKMKGNLGVYNYSFRITDRKTGLWKESLFKIFITNETFEGWYLLSEISGSQSRLDMLSYKAPTNTYKMIPDVLAAVGSSLKLDGAPNFVSFFNTNGVPVTNFTNDALAVGTTKMATFLGVDTLEHLPMYNFSVFMEDRTNAAVGSGSRLEGGSLKSYLWANDRVFTQLYEGLFDINRMSSGDVTPFKAAPFISWDPSSYGTTSILFNATGSEFVWYPGGGSRSCIAIENETLFKNKIDKNLLFMKYSSYNGGETFAILKDKTGNKVYLARFTVGKQNYFAEITGTPMAQAEQFEVNNDFGYVFYNVGSKLYEYDFNLKLNKEMADYGSRKISLLKFQYVKVGDPKSNSYKRYVDITKRLVVCSYDDGNLNNSGAMDVYSIPPVNGQLIKEESFAGMGKIVSITYRFR